VTRTAERGCTVVVMYVSRRGLVVIGLGLAVAGWLTWRWTRSDELEVTRVGPSPAGTRMAVILLHGYGAPGGDLVGLAKELSAARGDIAFYVPAGPYEVGMGGRSWIPDFTAPTREEYTERLEREVARTFALIWQVVETARSAGSAYDSIYVGGFSLGGRMAIEVATRAPAGKALGGLIVMSGGGMAELPDPVADDRPPLRVLVTHGTRDTVIGYSNGERLASALAAAGHDVRLFAFGEGHTIDASVRELLPAFLDGDPVGERVVADQ
jgi:phospholipase/carboxylesterase